MLGSKMKKHDGFRVTLSEKKKYVLWRSSDLDILSFCKILEKTNLKKNDKQLVKLIKSQLESDWRKPLIKTLKKIMRNYKE